MEVEKDVNVFMVYISVLPSLNFDLFFLFTCVLLFKQNPIIERFLEQLTESKLMESKSIF